MVDKASGTKRPNILLITSDQYRFPRFSYGPNGGFVDPLKMILGFQGDESDVDLSANPYAKFFPGFLKLRKNAAVLRNHTIATSACIPSRAAIYTGQYGTRTGVTQTDGLFKSGDSWNFPWLPADGIPTLGTWMREAGYTTHYFGKWHVSNPPEHSLDRYGFDDWESSYPEPHGASRNNLGVYRDAGFTDSACAFLRRKALGLDYNRAAAVVSEQDPTAPTPDPAEEKPWFAVASFTNPHDIATYPGVIAQALPRPASDIAGTEGGGTKTQSVMGPLTVPNEGQRTPAPTGGTLAIPLNPDGFPQNCGDLPPSWNEDLSTKPDCQFDYSYKVALGLAAKQGLSMAQKLAPDADPEAIEDLAVKLTLQNCIPFQLQEGDKKEDGVRQFVQLYGWLHSVLDRHVNAVLTTLEETGLDENTIVIFLADHGEYGGAHGMMIEKWHTAYQESLHVPVVVKARPLMEDETGTPSAETKVPRQIDALTSHIDILPTVLGLAGVGPEERSKISQTLARHRSVPPLPGIDLAPLIRGQWAPDKVFQSDGRERQGVLFITDDEICAPLPTTRDPHNLHSDLEYAAFAATVDAVRNQGVPLAPGAVVQPCHVRCVRTQQYKLNRYFDPSGAATDQWEMYDLKADPNEMDNLVRFNLNPPEAVNPALQETVDQLATLLSELEQREL
jgi:arylsulfatase A-like enzyme